MVLRKPTLSLGIEEEYLLVDPATRELVAAPPRDFMPACRRALGEQVNIGAEILYNGHRNDIGNVTLGGYTVLNLRARYAFNEAWSLNARLENLADRDYVVVHGYNVPGRSAFVQVVWRP